MSCCVPACAVPTCIPTCSPPVCYPVGGLGSLSSCGAGSYGSYGLGSTGGGPTAASLSMIPGASMGCITQLPPSEMVIHPPPYTLVVPGAALAATCEPVRVGGYTACATGASSSSGGGSRLKYYPCSPCNPCRN